MIYHGPGCLGGFAAAWAVSLILGRDSDTIYRPMQYGDKFPFERSDAGGSIHRVYLLDFSLNRPGMELLGRIVDSVICLDHHRSAARELAGLDGSGNFRIVFDMAKSGARLAWEHFHGNSPVPDLIRYVQDRDLWTWELPESKAINAALASYPHDFSTWDWLAGHLETDSGRDHLIAEGAAILRNQSAQVDSLVSMAVFGEIADHMVPIVNTPFYQSEVGEALCLKFPDAPFAATFFVKILIPDGSQSADRLDVAAVVSIRSRGDFDVSEVAKSLGGGGHKNAAGFEVKGPKINLKMGPE